MAEVLTVQITAQDGASKIFRAVSQSAQEVGTSVESAGKRGKAGLDQIGTAAQTNQARLNSLRETAMAVGAVMGTVAGAIAVAGRGFREQERQVAGITALYGDAADEMLAYAETVQEGFGYSNDAAREAMLIASSLVSNYELSAQQVNEIIARSADLAATFGTTLEDAVMRVSGAIRGEGEAAERLGLNLSDAAVAARALDAGITNWNVPGALSEAEKAAFRFQLLMEDTADTVGAASARGEGAGGWFREFIFDVQDATQAVGGFLGPIGQVAAEMAPLAIAAPVVGAGIGRIATAARNGSLAMAALGVATNPVVLGLSAVALVGGIAWASFREGEDAAKRLEGSLLALGDVAMNLRLSHLDEQANAVEDFAQQVEFIEGTASQYWESQAMYAEAEQIAADTGRDYADVLNELRDGYRLTADEANAFSEAQDAIGAAFADSRVDHEALSATLTDLYNQYATNQITLDEYNTSIQDVADNLHQYRTEQEEATNATALSAIAQQQFNDALLGTEGVLEDLDARYAAYHQRQREWIASALQVAGMDDPLSMWNLSGNASDAADLANNLTDAAGAADSMFRVIVGNTDAISSQANATLSWAEELINVRGELGRIDELVNAGLITGTSGVFDDGSQYAEAQNAYDSIAESVGRIEDNLDAVQAIQAPLMAEMTASTAAYTDELRKMEPQQQLIALSWMDQATAAQAMEIATLGASAAAGELGVNGPAAFEAMAIGAAQANPALAALLVDMEILDEHIDASGNKTYTVNTEGLDSATSDIDRLVESLDYLIDLMDDDERNFSVSIHADTSELDAAVASFPDYTIPQPITVPVEADAGSFMATTRDLGQDIDPVEVPVALTFPDHTIPQPGDFAGGAAAVTITAVDEATPVVDAAEANLAELDGNTAMTYINVLDEASAVILDVGSLLGGLDSASATVMIYADAEDAYADINAISAYNGTVLATSYIDIVTRQTTVSGVAGFTQRHGGFPGYEHGGVIFEAAEAGPELLHLQGGGIVPLPTHGLYSAPSGSYVEPANSVGGVSYGGTTVNVTVAGNVYGIDDLTAQVAAQMAPALSEVARTHYREQGTW